MINIVLPYDRADEFCEVWANDEENIDFRNDAFCALRCTVCFSATELVHYLTLLGFEAKVTDQKGDMTIKLICCDGDGEEFTILKDGDVVTVKASGRAGVLYGVYELLEAQGIKWYSPWEEYVPKDVTQLKIPCGDFSPCMPLGRGFDFEGPLKESKLLWLWMARNKLNMSTVRYNTVAYQRKLCMTLKNGGHIFEDIMNPNKKLPSGKTFFEEHCDWYGKSDAVLTPENALRTQFCVSNDELKQYLWENLLAKLNKEWYDADRIDVWGFDTWGRNCKCEKCKTLGNGADLMLYFLSYLRTKLDKALKDGEIDHNVRFVMCSYEGTATLEPPEKCIPQNLKNSGDYVTFYPILRCYEHKMDDENCSYNAKYQKCFEKWEGISLMMGEYYNVSRFEEMPLVFQSVMQSDFANYFQNGITGMTYMHLPMLDWGIKTLTQFLYAKLCWNVNADVKEISDSYYSDLYGEFALDVKKVYSMCEKAGRHISSWRNWRDKSILNGLQGWDGNVPAKDIYRDDHLGQNAAAYGKESIRLLTKALDIMTDLRIKADEIYMKDFVLVNGVAVNPNDIRYRLKKNYLGERISSDIRGLKYGLDMFKLLTGFLEYYEALYKKNDTEKIWNELRALCLECETYTYSVRYNHTKPELNFADVLERSGLRDVYYKCMAARIK